MQPSTGRAVGGQPPSERGACLLVKSTYQCRGYESSWAVVAHRVIRRRALLPCCSQRTLTRDIPETSLSIRSKGNVLNKSKPRGSPLKLSLVSRVVFLFYKGARVLDVVDSQRLRQCGVGPPRSGSPWWRLGRRHRRGFPTWTYCAAEYFRVVPYVCQGRPKTSRNLPADAQALGRASHPRLVRHAMGVDGSYSNNKPWRCGFGSPWHAHT